MEGTGPIRCGMPLTLHLLLDEQNSVILIQKAVVRWSRGSLVGVEFKWMSEEAQQRLSHFLWRATMTRFQGPQPNPTSR